jgi:hypothetical protein
MANHTSAIAPLPWGLGGSCPVSGGRTLWSSLASRSTDPLARTPGSKRCWLPVHADVAASIITLVVTFSSGGKAMSSGGGLGQLNRLASDLAALPGADSAIRAVLVGKGTPCDEKRMPLKAWARAGRAHCFAGPNVGTREMHSIWAFALDFYHHLPRIAVFTQDDPIAGPSRELLRLAREPAAWAAALAADYARRAARRGADGAAADLWRPEPCACHAVTESIFTESQYVETMGWHGLSPRCFDFQLLCGGGLSFS